MSDPLQQLESCLIEILLELLARYRNPVLELGRFAPPIAILFLNDLLSRHPRDMQRHGVIGIHEHRDGQHHALVHRG